MAENGGNGATGGGPVISVRGMSTGKVGNPGVHDLSFEVRAGLLMAEIAKAKGIQVGAADLEEGLKGLAEQTGKNLAKLKAEYSTQQKREMLVGMILENKVLDIIEAAAQIEQE